MASSAGSANTGAIDPLPELAQVCRERGAWFHVDGAYGSFAALTERGKGWLKGIELADSVTLDPHKWRRGFHELANPQYALAVGSEWCQYHPRILITLPFVFSLRSVRIGRTLLSPRTASAP